jgi:hypothetical protein
VELPHDNLLTEQHRPPDLLEAVAIRRHLVEPALIFGDDAAD